MNYAVIFAGGIGQRMSSKDKPKQFLEIHGKAIIIYTIEHFENHPEIDAIAVVCAAGWSDYLKSLLEKSNIKKVKWVLVGGVTALDSQLIGLKAIAGNEINDNDIVLIHDGVRPLIDAQLITTCINGVKEHGSAITIAPATETIVIVDENSMISTILKRDDCRLARAPQAFYLEEILKLHNKSIIENRHDFIDSVSMMRYYGKKIYTVNGPSENIKVTTPSDFYICRAIFDAKENMQLNWI